MALTAGGRQGVRSSADVPVSPSVDRAAGATSISPRARAGVRLDLSDWRALLVAGDLIAITVALSLSLDMPPLSASGAAPRVSWYATFAVIWLGVAVAVDSYNLSAATRWRVSVARAGCACLATVVVYLAIPFATPFALAPFLTSGPAALVFAVYTIVLLAAWRVAFACLASRPELRTRVLMVGAGWEGRTVVEAMRALGGIYEVVGFVDRDPERRGTILAGAPVIGGVADLGRLVDECPVDEILLAEGADGYSQHSDALQDALERGVRVARAADLYESITRRVLVPCFHQPWVEVLPEGARSGLVHSSYRRALDLAFAVPGTIALALVLPIVALAIRLDSPGPVFYSQERVGKGGRRFWITKLRSMRQDAEAAGQPIWAMRGDGRVTRVGRLLRRTRLDELPQCLSILKGDMSFIGPRPERPAFVDILERNVPCYRARHLVKPGLTGWAQVMYRYAATVEDARVKLKYDLYYIKHESPLLDLLVVLKTIGIVLRCRGT